MKTLLTEQQLRAGVERLAAELAGQYQGRPLTIVGILTGSLVFLADLIRLIDVPLRVGLVQASSYRGRATEPGELSINAELLPTIEGRDVLLIDDIFDTGHTLVEVISQLREHRPASIRSAVLLRKAERKEVSIEPDHVAFDIPNEFVVGYGLDYNDQFRNLPYVASLGDSDLDGDAVANGNRAGQ